MVIGLQYVWLIAVVFFLILEAITIGLTTIWFAGGALVAAIAAYFGVSLVNQCLLFVIASLILVILVRPIAMKYLNRKTTKTNVSSLIGRKVVVTKEINNLAETGEVKIGDIDWKAKNAEEDEIIPEGAVVIVEDVKGVTLVVHL